MKQLLLLTDFTANSAHAATTALWLCKKLNTDLLLYHSVQYVPFVNDYTYGSYVTETADSLFEESKEKLTKEVEALQPLTLQIPGFQPKINYESGEGYLGNNVNKLSGQEQISLIVMGGRTGGPLDHLLTGSETSAVIRNIKKPLLVIPEKADLKKLVKIVFATDFSATDTEAIDYLLELAYLLKLQIEVVHILKPGSSTLGIEREVEFRKYLNSLDQQIISYKAIFSEHIVQRLQDYCKETNAHLLAMTHARYDFISRLFNHSETKEVIANQQVAVMIFPQTFKKS